MKDKEGRKLRVRLPEMNLNVPIVAEVIAETKTRETYAITQGGTVVF